MNIALLGGAFDPPHLGHSQIVSSLLQNSIVDEVWYLPVKQHHFGKNMSSVEYRIEMLQLILPPKQVKIELYETKQEGINYSYQTLLALSKQYPQHTFSFVIGSDNLENFHKWLEKDIMLTRFTFYVYPRAGYPFKPLYKNMIPLEGMDTISISSTIIRQLLIQGKPITGLVDPKVERYIQDHKINYVIYQS